PALGASRAFAGVAAALVVTLVACLVAVGVGRGVPAAEAQAAADSAAVHLVSFRGADGEVWRESGELGRLSSTSPAFQTFVSDRLDALWQEAGSRVQCAHSVSLEVHRWLSSGFAVGRETIHAHGGDPATCTGGSALTLYSASGGSWHLVTGTQQSLFA